MDLNYKNYSLANAAFAMSIGNWSYNYLLENFFK